MDKKKILEFVKSLIESVLLGLILAVLIMNFILISVQVEGSSMDPTLKDKERGVSFVIGKTLGIKRFDVVVIKCPEEEKLLVKRVIGMPNDTVVYQDNRLYINGEYTLQPFLEDDVYTNNFEVTLGEDEYFCLGDNREISKDSRYYGAFKKDSIKATGIFIYYPFNKIGVK